MNKQYYEKTGTYTDDLVTRIAQYDPGSSEGKELIAIVQQGVIRAPRIGERIEIGVQMLDGGWQRQTFTP